MIIRLIFVLLIAIAACLAFPTVPADVAAAGAAEYRGLLQRNRLESSHAAAQASAIAAARILVHALELCGKDLSRERLVTSLEGLYEFDTGLMPKITFGFNRRIGALSAYVVTIDSEKNSSLRVWSGSSSSES